jgi:hypothetical protein
MLLQQDTTSFRVVISTSTLIFVQEALSKEIIHNRLAGIWIDLIVGEL